MWSILINVPCELENNLYSAIGGLINQSSWLMVLLSSTVLLLIFCLMDLSISDRQLLKFPSIIVNSSISPRSSIRFFLHVFWHSADWNVHIKDCYVLLEKLPLYYYIIPLFIHMILLVLKFSLSEISIATAALFRLELAWYNFLHCFVFIWFFICKCVSFLLKYNWHTISYLFQIYIIVIQYIYAFQDHHHYKSSYYLSP